MIDYVTLISSCDHLRWTSDQDIFLHISNSRFPLNQKQSLKGYCLDQYKCEIMCNLKLAILQCFRLFSQYFQSVRWANHFREMQDALPIFWLSVLWRCTSFPTELFVLFLLFSIKFSIFCSALPTFLCLVSHFIVWGICSWFCRLVF